MSVTPSLQSLLCNPAPIAVEVCQWEDGSCVKRGLAQNWISHHTKRFIEDASPREQMHFFYFNAKGQVRGWISLSIDLFSKAWAINRISSRRSFGDAWPCFTDQERRRLLWFLLDLLDLDPVTNFLNAENVSQAVWYPWFSDEGYAKFANEPAVQHIASLKCPGKLERFESPYSRNDRAITVNMFGALFGRGSKVPPSAYLDNETRHEGRADLDPKGFKTWHIGRGHSKQALLELRWPDHGWSLRGCKKPDTPWYRSILDLVEEHLCFPDSRREEWLDAHLEPGTETRDTTMLFALGVNPWLWPADQLIHWYLE